MLQTNERGSFWWWLANLNYFVSFQFLSMITSVLIYFFLSLASTHSCIDPNCTSCPIDISLCLSCAPFTYLTNNTCQACPIINCQTCNSLACSTCADGYFLTNNGTCTPCAVSNCSDCSNDGGECLQCFDKYYLIDNQCEQCPISNCDLCSSNFRNCYMCDSGYYPRNNKCEPCKGKNCSKCNPVSGQCYQCLPSYFLTLENTCYRCQVQYCELCASPLTCRTCIKNYESINNGQECRVVRIIEQYTSFPWYFWVLMAIAILIILLYAYRQLLKLRMGRPQGQGEYANLG